MEGERRTYQCILSRAFVRDFPLYNYDGSRNAWAYGRGVTIYPTHRRNITLMQRAFMRYRVQQELDAPAHEGELKYKFVMYLSNRVVYG